MVNPLWLERITMTPLRKRMTEDLQLKGYSLETQKSYLHAVELLARHYRRSPEAITEEQLRAYFLGLAKRSAASTLRIAKCAIKFCFATTLRKDWPVLGLVRAAKHSQLPVVLSRAEVRALLGCVRVPLYRVCLNTIYSCGLRISEGAHVQVGDIDSERQVLRVAGKGCKERQVPLAQPTLEALRAFWKLHRSRPWLFPARLQPHSLSEDGPVSLESLRHAFHAALQQSGVSKAARVHTLRHSYATHLMEAGVSLLLIQEILGHSSLRTTSIYTHLSAEAHAQVTQPLHALVAGL